jgi:hypothetical protein
MDPGQRRLAERRLLAALRRLHRREPLRADVRLDALIDEVRAAPPPAARGHRGSQPLAIGDDGLIAIVDAMAAAGQLVREGRRVRLPDHAPGLEPEMRGRVDRLLDGLREARAEPPRVDGLAARLGIPPAVIGQLRAAGELVGVAPGIDYPRDTYQLLQERIDRIAAGGPLSVARVRDHLHTSRRHAEALLAHRRAEKQRVRSSRRGG